MKQVTPETLATIADAYNNVLSFLQAVSVIVALLSLRAEKRTRVWFRRWTDVNLPTPPKPDPQYHMGLAGVLTDVATRLHTAEALRSVAAAQREAEKDTKGWERLPPTAQRVILVAITTN